MRYTNPEADKSRTQEHRAAVFVDYENVFSYLHNRVGSRERPDELINELLGELRRYLLEEYRTQTTVISAYADFSVMHGNGQYIQRALYMRGVEPRFVPSTLQKNAAEIQLCVDAIEMLHSRSDVRSFVLVTGDRPYLPLVQQFKLYGCRTLIVTFSPPPSTSEFIPYLEDDVFVDASNLLSETARRMLTTGTARPSTTTPEGVVAPPTRSTRPQPVTYRHITHEGAYHALSIIEEHFGQYEEVYLTPLLRKLSEILDEEQYDPKSLISELEDAGAVWLEKRRGFPYDYTVLLIDSQHPDVEAIQKALFERESAEAPFAEEEEEEGYVDEEEEGYVDEYDEEAEDYYGEDEYDDFEEEDLEEEEEEDLDDDEPMDASDEDYAEDKDLV